MVHSVAFSVKWELACPVREYTPSQGTGSKAAAGTVGRRDWEKQAIVGFHFKNPLEGYRRLTFMMLDADTVADRLLTR
jgi:hypothetical protein